MSYSLKNENLFLFAMTVVIGLVFVFPNGASAYVIQELPDTEVMNDFVLGPGKTELFLNPGDSVTRELLITNRLGRDVEILIDIEDFTGSRDLDETVRLLGGQKGLYSLRDYIHPELMSFKLSHGQRMFLPVEISIPLDAEPGGLYGSVLIAAQPVKGEKKTEEGGSSGGTAVITRLGTLFFIRVSGDAEEGGFLKSFGTKVGKRFFEKGPIPFEIIFENNGNVHLAPYGSISFHNLLGKEIASANIDPWFVMPDSLRAREIKWNRNFLFGKYTAYLKVDRGYGNLTDEAVFSFWVLPWKIIVAGLTAMFLIFMGLRWLFSNIEIKRKI